MIGAEKLVYSFIIFFTLSVLVIASPHGYLNKIYPKGVKTLGYKIVCPDKPEIGDKHLFNETSCNGKDGWLITNNADIQNRTVWLHTGMNYRKMGEQAKINHKIAKKIVSNVTNISRNNATINKRGYRAGDYGGSCDYPGSWEFLIASGLSIVQAWNVWWELYGDGNTVEVAGPSSCPNMPQVYGDNNGCIQTGGYPGRMFTSNNADDNASGWGLAQWGGTRDPYLGEGYTSPVWSQVNAYSDTNCENYDSTFDTDFCLQNLCQQSVIPFAETCNVDPLDWHLEWIQGAGGQVVYED